MRVESKAKEKSQMVFIPLVPGVGVLGAAIIGAGVGAAAGAASARAKSPEFYDPLTVCFIGQPGHEYVIRTLVENDFWEIEVVDDENDTNVKEPCTNKVD